MVDTIVNRVADSALITFDLEQFYQIGQRQTVDLSQWLDRGLVLKEKEFRAQLGAHDWSVFENYSFFCQPVNLWGFYGFVTIATQMFCRLIVRHQQ